MSRRDCPPLRPSTSIVFPPRLRAAGHPLPLDTDSRPRQVPVDNLLELRIQFARHERFILRVCQIGVRRFEKPEGGIYGVVFGLFAGIGETVGQAFPDRHAPRIRQNCARRIVTSRHERDTWQSDHRVSAPVAKPVIPRNDRLATAAIHNVLVRRCCQADRQRRSPRRFDEVTAPLKFRLTQCRQTDSSRMSTGWTGT